ncbi:cytochrome P450 [Actinokineospora auranticolor]|uniref:Pentalenic acid synthase n=1 Tax=Actinokineospora auranticolor TaxID=155976 RepID=A0A2S6H1Y0_9PSEU|nr:cytochrome P450 [Actinokineospora auranticolor]PPK71427.1 pentalenic acid synthase [Actinokineospora auranticolor]
MLQYPQDRQCPFQPSGAYQPLGAEGSLHRVELWNDETAWLVTGHATARALLSDPRVSADRTRPDFPVVLPRFEAEIFKPLALIGIDPPRHKAHRELLAAHFGLKQARAQRDEITALAHSLIDAIEAKGAPADLLADYALPIPSAVISRLLGVPYEDHAFFESASAALLQATSAAGAEEAGRTLFDYLDRLVTAERAEPTHRGLITVLAGAIGDGPDADVTHEDAVRIALTLLLGGHDTTAQMITLGVVTLLAHPEALAAIRADRDLLPAAVDELLRMVSVTDLSGVRVADADIEIDGAAIRAGEGLIFSSSMANRDPAVWPEPYELDFLRERKDPKASGRRHLTFGYGIHQCLGQNLARLELEIAFDVLFTRLPDLALETPSDALPYRSGGTMQGVHALPVVW